MFKPGDVVMVTMTMSLSSDHLTQSAPCPGWVGEVTEVCCEIKHNCCVPHITPRSHVKFSGAKLHCVPNIALKKLDGDPDAIDEPTEESVDA